MPQDIRWMRALNRWLGVAFVLLVLASCVVWLGRQPMLQIASVLLDGDLRRNNVPTVQANVRPHLQGGHSGFFSIDLAYSRQVFENLPWVRQAMVRRVWPNTLRVTLHEHQPAAYWQTGDREDLMVNTQGEIFEANTGDVADENVPTFKSPTQPTPAHAQQMLSMYRLLTPVIQVMAARIDTLRLTDRGSWSIKLDNEAQIELGRGQDAEVVARVARFVQTFGQLRRQYEGGLAYADLRYPRGYAVRLRGLTTMQALSPLNSLKPE
jgi:cell division protein FtsQ